MHDEAWQGPGQGWKLNINNRLGILAVRMGGDCKGSEGKAVVEVGYGTGSGGSVPDAARRTGGWNWLRDRAQWQCPEAAERTGGWNWLRDRVQ
jgi:hypothetical protein